MMKNVDDEVKGEMEEKKLKCMYVYIYIYIDISILLLSFWDDWVPDTTLSIYI